MSSTASTQELTAESLGPQVTACSQSEFDLMVACSSVSWSPEAESRVRDLLVSGVDWPKFLETSEQHGVLPFVQRRLACFASLIPPASWEDIKARMTSHVRRALRLTQLLRAVNDALEQAGLCVVAYKGPTLAYRLYGDVGLRQFSDLDLFLSTSDVSRATEALKTISVFPHTIFRLRELNALIKSGYELTFDGLGNQCLVELKWRVLPKFYAIDLSVEAFFTRAQVCHVMENRILSLCDEDLFLVLCVHAAKHGWAKLCWICDIAQLTNSSGVDWNRLMERAALLGVQRIVGISLFLARELLHSESSPVLERLIESDPEVRTIGSQIIRDMVSDRELHPESIAYFRLMLRTRERLLDRIRFVVRLIMTPTETEWSTIALPAALFPLYRLVRIWRLIGRALRFTTS